MTQLTDIARGEEVSGHRPWPRLRVTPQSWRTLVNEMAEGRATLLGLWGDAGEVHMAVVGETPRDVIVASLQCPDGSFPSVGALHPPAIRFERAIHSLFGLEPVGAPDARPWLDLGPG